MGLGRVMAFLLWSPRTATHWQQVKEMLQRSGLETAAWAMLTWFHALAPENLQPLIGQWRSAIAPGALRARYLELWLRHNLPSRLIAHPSAIQFGLTPFLHDRASDAVQAYRGWRSARRTRETDARVFLAQGEGAAISP
jgi:hypothetical protein